MKSSTKAALIAVGVTILGAGVCTCRPIGVDKSLNEKHQTTAPAISDESLIRKLARLAKEKGKKYSAGNHDVSLGAIFKMGNDTTVSVSYFDYPPINTIDTNDAIIISAEVFDMGLMQTGAATSLYGNYTYHDSNLDGVDSASHDSIFDNRKITRGVQREYMYQVKLAIKELSK